MDQQLFDLRVDAEVSSYLGQTARWAKFIAIVGFVMCGIMAILSFFLGALLATYSDAAAIGNASPAPVGLLTGLYLVLAVVLFVPYLYLFNFATKMQRALQRVDQDFLAKSFANLKSCFKFIGVVTIIGLALYGLGFLLLIVNVAFNQSAA